MNKQTTKGNKMHIISETTRPNGVKVTLGDHEENGAITFIVKDSAGHDTRFYGNYSTAVDRFNELVKTANASYSIQNGRETK